MPSIIEGYNYDIFISYRQKDNRHDGWVTEFVNNLKDELESTFKEEISVYFDNNPHDGLLETHDVEASLNEKLRCLIFIPVVSRTYCDPKSFAWEHEFKAFVNAALQDKNGLKIKLSSGNIAARVLPVQIHELNIKDRKLMEAVLGGPVRGVEFIYKEAGVNRPLRPDDKEDGNLCRTKYNNQLNKAANAICEIIEGFTGNEKPENERKIIELSGKHKGRLKPALIISAILLMLLIPGVLLLYQSRSGAERTKSIAVLPFINDSPNDSANFFINGIMEEIINNLNKIKEFTKVVPRSLVEKYKSERPSFNKIAKDLNVNYIIDGYAQMWNNNYAINIHLIDARNNKEIWGNKYAGELRQINDILSTESDIAKEIAGELKIKITPDEKFQIEKIPTKNLQAYNYYRKAEEHFFNYSMYGEILNLDSAEMLFKKSISSDSSFVLAYTGLTRILLEKNYYAGYALKDYSDSIQLLLIKALAIDNTIPDVFVNVGDYFFHVGKEKDGLSAIYKVLQLEPNSWYAYYLLGIHYLNRGDLINSIKYLTKSSSLIEGPESIPLLHYLITAYAYSGFTEKSLSLNQKIFMIKPDSCVYLNNLALLSFWSGEYKDAAHFMKRAHELNPSNLQFLKGVVLFLSDAQECKEGMLYLKQMIGKESNVQYNEMHRLGYLFWQNGYKKEGNDCFNKQLEISKAESVLNKYGYYDLACVYAFLGEKDQAIKNLLLFNRQDPIPFWMFNLIRKDPLLENIRQTPEYIQVVREVESKYYAEHERIRKWLEENNML